MRRSLALLCLGLAACAGASQNRATTEVGRGLAMPADPGARSQALRESGQRFYAALSRGEPEDTVLDALALRRVVDSTAATRYSAQRAGLGLRLGVRPAEFEAFRSAEFAGVCVQGARQRAAGGVLGLLQPTWTFDRVLVVGRRPGGQRVAAWLEGVFAFTDQGFYALDLSRAEAPRWEHSDLELASCDVEVGLH